MVGWSLERRLVATGLTSCSIGRWSRRRSAAATMAAALSPHAPPHQLRHLCGACRCASSPSSSHGRILRLCRPQVCHFSISSARRPEQIAMTDFPNQLNGAPCSHEDQAPICANLKQLKIFPKSYIPGQNSRMLCPKCGGGQSRELSLTVKIHSDGLFAKWNCFRATCGWRGHTEVTGITHSRFGPVKGQRGGMSRELSEEILELQELSEAQIKYFQSRGITRQTLERNRVKQRCKDASRILAFPYWKDGRLVSCKYLASNKQSWQEESTCKIFYGVDDLKLGNEIIIVQGELDKLAMEEAGKLVCVGMPDEGRSKEAGKEGQASPKGDKYEYLWESQDFFEKASHIILATNSDEEGQVVAEELARRLGREKCWCVNWPAKSDGSKCKNALEVLQIHGKEALRRMIDTAELFPIRGLFRFSDFDKEIDNYYRIHLGDELSVSTGWSNLDPYYRVVPGELTLVTGVPSSGKSEWIDALLCNLNVSKGWSFALCSMENQVREHGRKLLEKYLHKPFFNYPYSGSVRRMSEVDLERGKLWLNKSFYLIRCNDDELPSIQWVLDVAKSAVMRYGIRGLVIDPYNELDHQRPSSMTETEYVSQMLTKIKRFAQHHDCHVWFVAHPKQLQGWQGEAPSLYDISGSAHFINKCDAGIVVHRNRDPKMGAPDQVQILVRKVRNKAAGTIGDATLVYNRLTGEYKDYVGTM